MPQTVIKSTITGRTFGRALYIAENGRCFISRRYDIYRSDDWGATWQLDCRAPSSGWKKLVASSDLGERLLRYHISSFRVLADGARVAVARDGIYRAEPGETLMKRVFTITRGSRPLNFCVDGQRILFGEYGDNYQNLEVFIYVSEDGGKNFEVCYKFPCGSIRHVHSVLLDPYAGHYWVFVGDYDMQPGIGAMPKDLRNIDWLTRGGQGSRAVGAIVKPDCLLYGTDSDYDRNFIIRLDKQSGKKTNLIEVEGSSLYAASFGPVNAISTCVEPNPACPSQECSLYVSLDGDRWQRIYPHKKDSYHFTLFQLGTLILPNTFHDQPRGMFSGQAVSGAHNVVKMVAFEVQPK